MPELKSFDDLAEFIKEKLPDEYTITRSASGKVKVLGLVEFSEFSKYSNHDYRFKSRLIGQLSEMLWSNYLPEEILLTLDRAHAAPLYSYINEEMFHDISRFEKQALPVAQFNIDGEHLTVEFPNGQMLVRRFQEIIHNKETESHAYKMYHGELPIFARKFLGKYMSAKALPEKREKFIRVILSMHNLAKNGFDLPSTTIGTFVGTKHKNINRWLHRLVKAGQLEIVTSEYKRGKQAKRYKALNELEEFLLKTVQKNNNETTDSSSNYKLPTFIADGTWRDQTFDALRYHFLDDFDGYINWFRSLPGSREKNREEEAIERYKFFIKKHLRKYKDVA